MSETVTGPVYLAETRFEDDSPRLHLFGGGELAAFLKRNAEEFHYSGYGHEVLGLFRYGAGGTLTPLAMHCTGRDYDRAGDWLYLDYEVRPAGAIHGGGHAAEVAFAVRIDGRA